MRNGKSYQMFLRHQIIQTHKLYLIPVLCHRKIIYTTNIIEGLNRQFRPFPPSRFLLCRMSSVTEIRAGVQLFLQFLLPLQVGLLLQPDPFPLHKELALLRQQVL